MQPMEPTKQAIPISPNIIIPIKQPTIPTIISAIPIPFTQTPPDNFYYYIAKSVQNVATVLGDLKVVIWIQKSSGEQVC